MFYCNNEAGREGVGTIIFIEGEKKREGGQVPKNLENLVVEHRESYVCGPLIMGQ